MDHNLEDSLNLESAIGSMDFDHSGVVVNQEDITLEATSHEDIPMEFEQIEVQPMLMDTGSEEIIDFIGDQFTLQGYSVQDDPIEASTSSKVESNQLNELTSQTDSIVDLQFETDSIAQSIKLETPVKNTQPKYIAIQAALPPTWTSNKKSDSGASASVPRQVAIAPKPSNLGKIFTQKTTFTTSKPVAIAPQPVALVVNKSTTPRPVTTKPNTVLAQVGKQFVMLPAGAGQKIKLVPSSTGASGIQYVRASSDQAQLISTKSLNNPVMAKVIVQGQSNMDMSNQPAVITRLLPANTTAQARYVMQQKTVPITFGGNKVLITSPTKQGMKLGKKQIIAIKSKSKLVPATSQTQASTTKKVVITSNPNQNVVLKTTAPSKSKDSNVVMQGQRTQLHQINVPGKGIQYIRLITNQTPQAPKPAPKSQTAVPSKTFVLTDTKGNVIQVTAEKMVTGQPPPLVITGKVGIPAKVAMKPQKKFVRIAPVSNKTGQPTQPIRSAQSLLAPITSMSETAVSLDEFNNLIDSQNTVNAASVEPTADGGGGGEAAGPGVGEGGGGAEGEEDSKAALRALIEGAIAEEGNLGDMQTTMHEVEVEFQRDQSPVEDENSNSLNLNDPNERSVRHPLIVIPSNCTKQQRQITTDDDVRDQQHHVLDESQSLTALVNVEAESMPFDSPTTPPAHSDNDMERANDLDLRPRKACNCTKSQCLKLYCDCFANGEFCNRCNCNNCHNNLENEELRQKAIRACLDRNPNAFRPKIGKAKLGGPEIIRRHNKGCNCKRSGCLKNYCECYEAKIACTSMCKCVGCRNIEETLERRRDAMRLREKLSDPMFRPPSLGQAKQPCSFMTTEVIEAVCQCLLAAAVESGEEAGGEEEAADPMRDVIEEFARCLQDIIGASQATPLSILEEGHA